MFKSIKYFGFLPLLSSILILGCNKPSPQGKNDKFVITDSLISRLVIDTIKEANNLSDRNFSARISADENKMARIYPMVSGIIKNVSVELGDKVASGQLLANMNSMEIASFDKEAIASDADLKNAERAFKNAESMFKGGLISGREFEEAKNTLQVAKAEYNRTATVLRLNGGSKNGTYRVKSPISGVVIEKNVNNNMQFRPDNDQNIFTIADLSKVWAIINIYESDISRIEEGNEVAVSVLSYPDKNFKGKIDKIYSILDAESKVINAKVIIDNSDNSLKPGMMATVKIAVKSKTELPVTNSSNIIFDNNKNYILLLNSENKIVVNEVKVAFKAENKAYISKGLNTGDKVIGSKQVFLFEGLKNQ